MPRTLLSAHELVRTIGPRTLLDRVSLTVDDGTRTALIGRNGAGKSTLLSLLAGETEPDGGTIVRAHGVAVLYLPQLDGADDARSVRATLHARLGVAAAAQRMDALAERMAAPDPAAAALDPVPAAAPDAGGCVDPGPSLVDAHADALGEWLARGGADLDARLDRAADDAGLQPALLDRTAAQLSGGQRARAMLAAVTAARSDVLLLDEPANHLDADGLRRLRTQLQNRPGGLVLVAHDRRLLADVSDRVVALDAHTGAATTFGGGWAAYERERDRSRTRAQQAHDRGAAERDRLVALERAARARSQQGQRNARSENDKNLKHLYEQTAQNVSGGLAAQLARKAAKVEVPDAPWREKATRLRFAAPATAAGIVAALRNATLRRGAFTIGPLDLTVGDGERILLTGANGTGKSTIIAALTGRLQPESGEARRVATAEVAQERGSLLGAAQRRLVVAVRDVAGLDEREARAALAAMGIGPELAQRPIGSLSPGERTRAELAAATAAGARLLVLDEPTNHLDVPALEALEAALHDWPGALVVATHDARLRDGLRLDTEVDVTAL